MFSDCQRCVQGFRSNCFAEELRFKQSLVNGVPSPGEIARIEEHVVFRYRCYLVDDNARQKLMTKQHRSPRQDVQ